MESNSRRTQSNSSMLVLLIAVLISPACSIWWSIATRPMMDAMVLGTQPICGQLEGLSRNQRALCQRYANHMAHVSEGAGIGINECKWQFRGQRWNCSTVDDSSVFGKVLKIGSKETAFTYAISAAGVVVAVARACKNEQLENCGCGNKARPEGLDASWRWGGCGDNTEYAYGFAREFIDARERDNISPKRRKDRERKVMNMHNNEAGRMVVVRSARPTCKCHGVSGSCSLKTCWMQVPGFREIGDELMRKYIGGVEVRVTNRGQLRPRRSNDEVGSTSLVYLDSSPDYCDKNRRTGVAGTKGRECKKDSSGPEGCGLLCCGRGFRTYRVRVVEKCECKFQWCCSVKCNLCQRTVKRHICR
uniref:Protein Wnt n=1 Tax=Ciona intestinalis TaxID=7719 RepID=Q9U6V0_CIOIN|nr:Wnt signaling ligand precursor [Ciona intestinalis]AAD52655.1 Wnt-5 protein precursor [Ciona intestinalis]BAE06753.1 Wnt signaling ligand [Ciona intestinalis]|eukprot:NP_001027951.1 Wnt signaling ligand precursor [Ciona intestinalis]